MAANSNEGLVLGDDVCGLDFSVKLGSSSDAPQKHVDRPPSFCVGNGRRAPTLSSVCKGQLPAVRPEIAFGALARCLKCSADSLEIVGAISAKPTFGLTRVSQKG